MRRAPFIIALACALVAAGSASAVVAHTTRVSVASNGVEGNQGSVRGAISATGRYVAFASLATNLVASDTNDNYDIFVRDRRTGVTTRVSIDSSGNQGGGVSYSPALSATGRFVAFGSSSTDLVPNDTNAANDIFVRDRSAHTTRRVSINSSSFGGNGDSDNPAISADGRFVAFESSANNLVLHDTNGLQDIFVRDRKTRKTTRVNINSRGRQALGGFGSYDPAISGNGRFVVFKSYATNLIAHDTNGQPDVFVRDRLLRKTTRISVSSSEHQANSGSQQPSISGDGRFVVFLSDADNLVANDTNAERDVFIRDRKLGTTRRLSISSTGLQSDGSSDLVQGAISSNGRYVTFTSSGTTLVPGDMNLNDDVFLRDRGTGKTRRLSLGPAGVEGNSYSEEASISGDARFVDFSSAADNLVNPDSNIATDIFVRGPLH